MNAEHALKALYIALAHLLWEQYARNGNPVMTVTDEVINSVPKNFLETIEFKKIGVGLTQVSIRDKMKPMLWDRDIMVPRNKL